MLSLSINIKETNKNASNALIKETHNAKNAKEALNDKKENNALRINKETLKKNKNAKKAKEDLIIEEEIAPNKIKDTLILKKTEKQLVLEQGKKIRRNNSK